MYGETFLYWYGTKPRLAITDPGLIKKILMDTSGIFDKPDNFLGKLQLGDGLATIRGEKWAIHRRIAALALSMEQVKGWVLKIVESTVKMLEKWEEKRGLGKDDFEMEVHKQLHDLSAEIISRTIFRSSFEEGNIFILQEKQMHFAFLPLKTARIPGFR